MIVISIMSVWLWLLSAVPVSHLRSKPAARAYSVSQTACSLHLALGFAALSYVCNTTDSKTHCQRRCGHIPERCKCLWHIWWSEGSHFARGDLDDLSGGDSGIQCGWRYNLKPTLHLYTSWHPFDHWLIDQWSALMWRELLCCSKTCVTLLILMARIIWSYGLYHYIIRLLNIWYKHHLSSIIYHQSSINSVQLWWYWFVSGLSDHANLSTSLCTNLITSSITNHWSLLVRWGQRKPGWSSTKRATMLRLKRAGGQDLQGSPRTFIGILSTTERKTVFVNATSSQSSCEALLKAYVVKLGWQSLAFVLGQVSEVDLMKLLAMQAWWNPFLQRLKKNRATRTCWSRWAKA